jgi:hypothetical protein
MHKTHHQGAQLYEMSAYIFVDLHVEKLLENLRRRKSVVDDVLHRNWKQLVAI